METMLDEEPPRSRVAVLLKRFSQIEDGRQSWRVAFPLAEMLLLLTCATVADYDDFDEIVAWVAITCFLRRFAPFHFGIPSGCGRWSTVSIRCCSGAVSRAGSRNSGPAGMI
jgi:DDE_Tnp_1-associated